MKKNEVIKGLSELKRYDISSKEFQNLLVYVSGIDPNIDSAWSRRLSKILYKIDHPYALQLIDALEGKRNLDEDYLFRIARQAGIPRKEFYEAKHFYSAVNDSFEGEFEQVFDLCSGNGLNGFFMLRNGKARRAQFYDVHDNKYFRTVAEHFDNYEFHEEDIHKGDIEIEGDSIVIGVHCCGDLTDRLIEIAVSQRKPFAVMPCCYNHHVPYLVRDASHYFQNMDDTIDVMRIMGLRKEQYEVELRIIPQDVTEKNRIIIGKSK